MRSVSVRAGVVLAVVVLFAVVPCSYADGPYQPPEARIMPPGGYTTQSESPSFARVMWSWLMARILPPIGLE